MDGKQREQLELLKKRLPHYMSNEKAKELKIEDWGTPEDVEKMAKMPRGKKDQKGTKNILNEIRRNGELKNNYNKELKPRLSRDSIGKLLNGDWEIAGNIDHLFKNSIEPHRFELDQSKDNHDLESIRYLFSPMSRNEEINPVKITVKELKDQKGTYLYSGERIKSDLRKKNKDAGQQRSKGDSEIAQTLPARRPYDPNIPQSAQKIKEGNDV
jgi:hypothetical protein